MELDGSWHHKAVFLCALVSPVQYGCVSPYHSQTVDNYATCKTLLDSSIESTQVVYTLNIKIKKAEQMGSH